MCAPDAPEPPDPKETSAASTATNVGTAIANANLGNVNQVTPDGSLTYSQTGTYKLNDLYTGKSYDIPTYTATQALSGTGQAIKDQTDQAKLNLGELAAGQSAFLKDWLAKPVDLSNGATEARLMDLGMKRLQPALDARRQANEADLINRGIRPGSDNYAQAQNIQNQGENDAYNSLMLSGRGQAVQEALAQNSAPINNLTALLSGSQVSQPNFINANMPTIPTTDTAGLINTNYQQRLAASQANNQNIMGGLFGLGGSLLQGAGAAGGFGAMFSDRRLKKNIRAIGNYANGLTKYVFEYLWGDNQHVGVMSDEVRAVRPYAVTTINGFDAVDYGKALA
ncbi:MAG: tail fiber domain-containing protein [Mesorhizobium sp.]|uniref:tail fiber domain-containing protein n=1 Tax=Mesorhizobium sp. TaxID=1871066 RepID=UPI000FE4DDA5|nr:tail fiber domain-containing protein [Mesorhizobium sp.]RWK79792.1 MAG: tail fiber domain-containing protein [Mesorhizobium sp.]RWK82406.1 MAG: tail fiber domain-containing protein [Mesorhizobium sp.]RWL08775.1 MAG: tail fiber domain-containing protein [Mesorhizobium sp.]